LLLRAEGHVARSHGEAVISTAAAHDLLKALLDVGENLIEVRRFLAAPFPGILSVSTTASGLIPGHLILRSVARAK
jgi:hypothetical protein